ncbi:MAG: DEAD/DEAH box helicase family protein [Flavobacteriales bacterium]|jgi:predicted helicase|nr:DEAD/DEAH box helicase family protein [Flavobacteriales bacterium]
MKKTFDQTLEEYREISFSERDKGDRFERLMQAYLQTDPTYTSLFQYVWLWNEFPNKDEFGGKDTGIDLVALTYEGDYWAIQCKCYQENSTIDKKSVDSFLSTSSREFKDSHSNTIGFSQRLWISTTNKWGANAQEAIRNQNPPVTRINLTDLQNAPVDWEKLESGITGELARTSKKELYEHQKEALNNTEKHFSKHNRGKLIMACGTGKTFTSLRIAENETKDKGLVLFLVPSIALLGQTLREWSANSKEPINPICICSDSKITRQQANADFGDSSAIDLALPASTDVKNIVRQFQAIDLRKKSGMTVVFSTYQSIEVIAKAQNELSKINPNKSEFDLIICDEAHRTTGVSISKEDSSAFVKVHDNDFIKSKKRLYMTATPRLFSDDSKSKATQNDAILCSMDDESLYGQEMFRIGFGEAVEKGMLTDYKVLILTLNDTDVPASIQRMIANSEEEITADDASKLIGCVNALSKQVLGDEGLIKNSDPEPMKRAVAFCQNISVSKKITNNFNDTTDIYLDDLEQKAKEKMVSVSSNHIDGSMSAPERDELLNWLKSTSADANECRVLTNVRCLSEGVDVPSLDAVLFLSARNSQVDVVQSVGRVMRKAKGKKYGYIIIPVVVPTNVEASKALDNNDRFKVVWSVLNALRAHDDRFNATINKIDLNKKKPNQILVGGASHGKEDFSGDGVNEPAEEYGQMSKQLALQFEELQGVMYAKMVKKVGDRVYWEKWAKDVAIIAENQIARITHLVEEDSQHQKAFNNFLLGLQKNINPSISKDQAIEMLSQHIITKPVFEALFEGYSFVENNAVSKAMQSMMNILENSRIEKDTQALDKFYKSVKKRASGIDNAEGKQKIIIELYDKFFKTAFPKMVEQLGIVYTPVEVVDFIIHSVNDVLKKEFNRTVSDENVHILDPFTGTGTFITRLLQSGLIKQKDLFRKYTKELHANEIVLLAYYIAAVNIENAYHDATEDPNDGIGKEKFTPFDGIVLTDTFQLAETQKSEKLFSEMFPQNSERVQKQKDAPIQVIMGNPPYSIGQKSANDNAQNQEYTKLNSRIENTYAKASDAGLSKSLYDAYIKAFRWSTDRLSKEHGGVIAFVSNGAWLDGNSTDGFRKTIEEEFSSIYVFNLRGNQRTSGELSRKEGGKIFGSGSRTPISITLLIKQPNHSEKATIYYHDIGDYLSQKEKLQIIADFKSVDNLPIKTLKPNIEGDWINQRNTIFDTFIPIEPEKKFDTKTQSFFNTYAVGISTSRDYWIYNFSRKRVLHNMKSLIEFYNNQRFLFHNQKDNEVSDVRVFLDNNPNKISWSRALRNDVKKNKPHQFKENVLTTSLYRPFNKITLYNDRNLIESPGLNNSFFPSNHDTKNVVISITGKGSLGFSFIITNVIPDVCLSKMGNGGNQTFPLYYYEKNENKQNTLFDANTEDEFIRKDGVSDFILKRAIKQYGKSVSKEDIFYYVYGILHSSEYRATFANDLKKMLPRIPLVDKPKDFWAFSKAGRSLADLHLNYEEIKAFEDVKIVGMEFKFFKVEKMRFGKKKIDIDGKKKSVNDKSIINFNSKITITNIPEKAYEYKVNGKSAIEWIMERYQVKTDKKSGITNNPNDWADEVGNPKYILNLLLSIINLSVQTVEIVDNLPKLKFD